MKITGEEILNSKKLTEFLVGSDCRVSEIKWFDGSITKGYGKEINIEKVNNIVSLTESLWSEEIRNNIELTIELSI